MSVRQIRNFKLKFPKDRLREEGTEESAEDGGGDTLTETDDRLPCGAETEEEDPLQDELQPQSTGSASTRSSLLGVLPWQTPQGMRTVALCHRVMLGHQS